MPNAKNKTKTKAKPQNLQCTNFGKLIESSELNVRDQKTQRKCMLNILLSSILLVI